MGTDKFRLAFKNTYLWSGVLSPSLGSQMLGKALSK